MGGMAGVAVASCRLESLLLLLSFYFWQVAALAQGEVSATPVKMCPGTLNILGTQPVWLTNAVWNIPGERGGQVDVSGDTVVAHLKSRTYFADACSEGTYTHSLYQGVPLLGMTMRYSTSIVGAGCGCNAALYLTSMKQNEKLSNCSDYYCDANSVCGVQCAELDIQEANERAWRTTLHARNDSVGTGAGYGGAGPHHLAFSASEYGPGARCIDTQFDFDVAVSFPTNSAGVLEAVEVTLSQAGKPCPLSLRLGKYHSMSEISAALSAGMTPIISYWRSKHMRWLDGGGKDGPDCKVDHPSICADSVKFYGFSIGPYTPPPETTPQPAPAPAAAPWAPQPQPSRVPKPSLRQPTAWTPQPTPAPQPQPSSMTWIPGAYPWAQVTSSTGIYYYNAQTMQVSWNPPPTIV
mmetsp:Transcript_129796/g.361662  ORF Transcript_129796/g.361662 Transcript_129796/m.361662 type:complete len:408 (-) Transcript_129796:125-1348(-)|eukprot:CAMPEP_0179074976 /NCGR_PEP_ID=MMETSP0796-20121207/33358_1 /TAXON_ID=73915 /ORGANISM="Pyrodinium bahamense, Strain pbaha01" /LENGTH=407 /DNA_ID=CAMNT_0020772205 /DNA_START=15 /DNA_END=1238 /DNA_ORIENTATION=+